CQSPRRHSPRQGHVAGRARCRPLSRKPLQGAFRGTYSGLRYNPQNRCGTWSQASCRGCQINWSPSFVLSFSEELPEEQFVPVLSCQPLGAVLPGFQVGIGFHLAEHLVPLQTQTAAPPVVPAARLLELCPSTQCHHWPHHIKVASQYGVALVMSREIGRAGNSYPLSLLRSRSFTTAGLAFPLLARITWPTKKPKTFSLPPRNSSTCPMFAAMISSMIFSISPVSETWTSPFSATISSGRFPDFHISSKTVLAILLEMVPLSIRASSSASTSGDTGHCSMSSPLSLRPLVTSPMTQLAAIFA